MGVWRWLAGPSGSAADRESMDDACEFPDCDDVGDWVIDPYDAEIYDREVEICLCAGHLQSRYDAIDKELQ